MDYINLYIQYIFRFESDLSNLAFQQKNIQ